jgi:hypothetical protein
LFAQSSRTSLSVAADGSRDSWNAAWLNQSCRTEVRQLWINRAPRICGLFASPPGSVCLQRSQWYLQTRGKSKKYFQQPYWTSLARYKYHGTGISVVDISNSDGTRVVVESLEDTATTTSSSSSSNKKQLFSRTRSCSNVWTWRVQFRIIFLVSVDAFNSRFSCGSINWRINLLFLEDTCCIFSFLYPLISSLMFH